MTEIGTIRYEIEPWGDGDKYRVVSQVWNHGMFRGAHWFKNQVAICNSREDAEILIAKIEAHTKNPG